MHDRSTLGGGITDYLMDDAVIRERQKREVPLFGATPGELRAAYELSLERTRGSNRNGEPLSTVLRPESVALFVGQGRSGHSLIGALLDAHPDCVIAHELNVCNLIASGFDRDQICYLMWENSRHFAKVGRAWGRYSYAVPGAQQGRFRKLRVIGDKKGGSTSDFFYQARSNFTLTAAFFGVPLRFIHVVRNPLDNIAAMAMLSGGTAGLDFAIANFVRRCIASAQLLEAGTDDIITIYHEDVLSSPRGELVTLAEWLELTVEPAWLDACAQLIVPSPSRSRDKVTWSASQKAIVRDLISRHAFLRRYEDDL